MATSTSICVTSRCSWVGVPMIVAASRLGLRNNLRLCLDAGDGASYASGQVWLDTSGNGYDFNRGSGSGSDGADPTFNGTSGRRSSAEYFSGDGGDYFTYDNTNETWMQNLHKDNALWTCLAWCRAATNMTSIFGTNGGVANVGTGVHMAQDASRQILIRVVNSTASVLNLTSSITSPVDAWFLMGLTVKEAAGAGGGFFSVNATFESFDATYSSPSSGNASQTIQLLARGNGANIAPTGASIAALLFWEGRALSQGEVTAFFQATRARFGV